MQGAQSFIIHRSAVDGSGVAEPLPIPGVDGGHLAGFMPMKAVDRQTAKRWRAAVC